MNLLAELIRTAPLVHPVPGFNEGLYRLKYCFRGLLFPRLTRDWLHLLQAPELGQLVRAQPRLFSKLQRPYLHRLLEPKARLETLRQHYSFVISSFSNQLRQAIFQPRGLCLARLPLKENAGLTLRLLYFGQFEKEGELTLGIFNETSPQTVCFLTFSVSCATPHQRELFIGGLQGSRLVTEREDVIAITRQMHGLRPKALLFFAIQQLASCWKMTSIRAVSDEMHIYRHIRKRKTINARYNEFWTECGGQRFADGMFALPVSHAERDLTGLKATKRQMYRHRYAMLKQLAAEISTNLVNTGIRLVPEAPGCTESKSHDVRPNNDCEHCTHYGEDRQVFKNGHADY